MSFRGHVENGIVVLDKSVVLEDGTEVVVNLVESDPSPSLAERFRKVIGTVPDLPKDMAANHDSDNWYLLH